MSAVVSTQTAYDELVDILQGLPGLLRKCRESRRLTLAQAGAEMGVDASTVMRLERGDGGSLRTIVAAVKWLGESS